jgi:hypothetical protein
MTIEVSFESDEPLGDGPTQETFVGTCMLCGQPLKCRWWIFGGRRIHGTVHDKCAAEFEAQRRGKKTEQAAAVPDRFKEWDSSKFHYLQALSQAQSFEPNSKYRTLVIMGDPGKGKSRLAWQIVRQFFDIWSEERHQTKWVEYFTFSDLLTEYDQSKITKVKMAQFVFLDDLAKGTPGRTMALIQEVVRFRIKQQKWTFLTLDDEAFDAGLEDLFRERAVVVTVE